MGKAKKIRDSGMGWFEQLLVVLLTLTVVFAWSGFFGYLDLDYKVDRIASEQDAQGNQVALLKDASWVCVEWDNFTETQPSGEIQFCKAACDDYEACLSAFGDEGCKTYDVCTENCRLALGLPENQTIEERGCVRATLSRWLR